MVNKLISPGLAPDTPEVESKLRSKFVDPPPHQANSLRAPAPPSNELLEETVSAQILSFARGLGGGPTATRPDFIGQIIGDKGSKPGITVINWFCNIFANGDAPDELRPCLGGAVGHAGKNIQKTRWRLLLIPTSVPCALENTGEDWWGNAYCKQRWSPYLPIWAVTNPLLGREVALR